jgi:hypothetical protein
MQELEHAREAAVWEQRGMDVCAAEKLRAEAALLRQHLSERDAEVAALHARVADSAAACATLQQVGDVAAWGCLLVRECMLRVCPPANHADGGLP